jgi:hypothetical protein
VVLLAMKSRQKQHMPFATGRWLPEFHSPKTRIACLGAGKTLVKRFSQHKRTFQKSDSAYSNQYKMKLYNTSLSTFVIGLVATTGCAALIAFFHSFTRTRRDESPLPNDFRNV